MSRIRRTILAALMLFSIETAYSQSHDLVGDWVVVTTGFSFVGSTTSYMELSVEDNNGELEAYIFTGPAPIRVEGNDFEVDLAWRSGFDVEYLSTFHGTLKSDGTVAGALSHNGASNFLGRELKDGTFTGTRAEPAQDLAGLPPQPVDLSGVYTRASGLGGVSSIRYSMTEKGQQILDEYLEMDNANSRCASPGLVLASGLPYPMEIVQNDKYILIVYGADYARRVYMDGREFPETETSSSLGFSTGEWKGETLVVTSTHLNPAFISSRGQPVSENAEVIEQFYFDNKGYLHADMWVNDPENYSRTPHLRRVYDRDFSPRVITKVDCDPYTFFRAMDLEGDLDTFWERSRYRR